MVFQRPHVSCLQQWQMAKNHHRLQLINRVKSVGESVEVCSRPSLDRCKLVHCNGCPLDILPFGYDTIFKFHYLQTLLYITLHNFPLKRERLRFNGGPFICDTLTF